MTPRIDIVGHFGSRLSYATVASEVCRAVFDRGQLGEVVNLDDAWHQSHDWLRGRSGKGTHAIIFSEPRHFFDAYLSLYGRENVGIFASPNTDCMGREQTLVCCDAGRVFVPSRWCSQTVQRSAVAFGRELGDTVRLVPLGVSPHFLSNDDLSLKRLTRTINGGRRTPRRILHIATDHVWPGRKGTEELIAAWAKVVAHPMMAGTRLTIHAPRGVYEQVHYAVAQNKLTESVDIEFPPAMGSNDETLAKLYAEHDMLVLAPRCEGFGMMILAGLMNEMPTVTVRMTGQEDFLGKFSGWTAVPVGLSFEKLAYEDGCAPVVEADQVATTLLLAASAYGMLLSDAQRDNREEAKHWTWPSVHARWTDTLDEWTEESR